jgi:ribosomal protein L12E/L44/L45/RPP1/RPP2
MKELVNQLRGEKLKERMLGLRDELAAVEPAAAGPHDQLRKLLGIDPPAASKPARKRTKRP